MYKHNASSIKESDVKQFVSLEEKEKWEGKAESTHDHNDIYYTKDQFNNRIDELFNVVSGETVSVNGTLEGFTKDLVVYGNTSRQTHNSVNNVELLPGKIDDNTGLDDNATGYSKTNFISVLPHDRVSYKNGNEYRGAHLIEYDANKNKLLYRDIQYSLFRVIHPDTRYIRLYHYDRDNHDINISISRTDMMNIKSVGELNDNVYSFDIFSFNENILKPNLLVTWIYKLGEDNKSPDRYAANPIEVKGGKKYKFITKQQTFRKYMYWLDADMKFISDIQTTEPVISIEGIAPQHAKYLQVSVWDNQKKYDRYKEMSVNEWTVACIDNIEINNSVQYTEYRTQLDLPIQLDAVDEYKDKLFVKNGNLFIEKNIRTITFTGDERWILNQGQSSTDPTMCHFMTSEEDVDLHGNSQYNTKLICDRFPYQVGWGSNYECCFLNEYKHFTFTFNKSRFSTVSADSVKQWVRENNITVKYVLRKPYIIDLGPVTNFALKTFKNTTNITTEKTPTKALVECKIPNSIGGLLSTTNDRLLQLRNEVDELNSLVAGSDMHIEFSNPIKTIHNAQLGSYFDDIKIYGKTLHNIIRPKKHVEIVSNGTGIGYTSVSIGEVDISYPTGTKIIVVADVRSKSDNIPTVRLGGGYVHEIDLNYGFGIYKTSVLNHNNHRRVAPYIYNTTDTNDTAVVDILAIMLDTGSCGDIDYGSIETGLVSVSKEFSIVSMGNNMFKSSTPSKSNDNVISMGNTIQLEPGTYRYEFIDPGRKASTTYGVYYQNYNARVSIALSRYTSNLTGEFTVTEELSKHIRGVLPHITEHGIGQDDERISQIKFMLYKIPTYNENYEEYVNIKKTISLKNPLRSLPNGVCDTIEKINGTYVIVRRCGLESFNGTETGWVQYSDTNEESSPDFNGWYKGLYNAKASEGQLNVGFSDRLYYFDIDIFPGYVSNVCTREGIFIGGRSTPYVKIAKDKEKYPTLESFSSWLLSNNLTIVYELASPIIEELDKDISIPLFDNGSIHIQNSFSCTPRVEGKVTVKLANSLQTIMDKISFIEQSSVMVNRIKLRSLYEANKTRFGIHIMSTSSTYATEVDIDLYGLMVSNIQEGVQNYNRTEMEEQIDFYTMVGIFNYTMAGILFDMMDSQCYETII